MDEDKKTDEVSEKKDASQEMKDEVNTSDDQKEKKEKCFGGLCDNDGCCGIMQGKNPFIWLIAGVIIIGVIIFFAMGRGDKVESEATPVSKTVSEEVTQKTQELLKTLVPAELAVEIGEVMQESGLYMIPITVDGQEVKSYMTKDFTKFIPQLIDVKEMEEQSETEEQTLSADEVIPQAAQNIGLDMEAFNACVTEERYAEKVEASVQEGQNAGVTGTPHNVIMANGVQYELSGAVPEDQIAAALDALLSGTQSDLTVAENRVQSITASDHYRGKSNANVVFVEYSDVDCPFCKRHHDVMERVFATYGDRVGFVFRPFPIDQLHPDARAKSEAAECAKELGGEDAYWAYLGAMFQS
jgi:protein-disulfide isomerase